MDCSGNLVQCPQPADGLPTGGVDFLAETSSGSPIPSKGRGGIEFAFRPDWENFNASELASNG